MARKTEETKIKKIKLVISSYDDIENPVYAGGGARCVHELAKRFAQKYDVTVITGNYKGAKENKIDGVNYKRVGLSVLGTKIGQLIFHFLLPFYVKKLKHNIWFESFTPPFSTSLTPLFTKKPVIALVHQLSGEDMKRKYKFPFDFLEKTGLKFYKNIVVMNEGDMKKIKEINSQADVVLISNGINLPSKINRPMSKHILFLGRIEVDQKGLDLLLEAYSRYQDEIRLPLVIAGSGAKKQTRKLKSIIKQRQLSFKVSYVGKVEGREKLDLIGNSACVVVPSRYETFSMVALESMSQGTPIATFNIKGLGWIPENIRLVAKSFNIDDLGRNIIRISTDVKLRKKLSNKVSTFSKSFDWGNVYERYSDYTKEIINRNKKSEKDDFIGFINQSIERGKKFLLISPHFDDAVFSAGGLISYLSEKNANVEVVNIFTKASSSSYTLSAKNNLKLNGVVDAEDLYEKRRLEDKAVFKDLEINVKNLGFVEALYRKRKSVKKNLLSKYIPELLYVYPTYHFHILSGVVANEDKDLLNHISKKIKDLRDVNGVVLCPLGNARHVDHIIARTISEKVYENVIYYKDCPYGLSKNAKEFIRLNSLKKYTFPINRKRKERLVNFYKTQTRSLPETKLNKLLSSEIYFTKES